jgi:hypothetical protein
VVASVTLTVLLARRWEVVFTDAFPLTVVAAVLAEATDDSITIATKLIINLFIVFKFTC